MISSKQIRAAWIDAGTLIQHSGIGGFGKWDGSSFYLYMEYRVTCFNLFSVPHNIVKLPYIKLISYCQLKPNTAQHYITHAQHYTHSHMHRLNMHALTSMHACPLYHKTIAYLHVQQTITNLFSFSFIQVQQDCSYRI